MFEPSFLKARTGVRPSDFRAGTRDTYFKGMYNLNVQGTCQIKLTAQQHRREIRTRKAVTMFEASLVLRPARSVVSHSHFQVETMKCSFRKAYLYIPEMYADNKQIGATSRDHSLPTCAKVWRTKVCAAISLV